MMLSAGSYKKSLSAPIFALQSPFLEVCGWMLDCESSGVQESLIHRVHWFLSGAILTPQLSQAIDVMS